MALYSFRIEEVSAGLRTPEEQDLATMGERGADQGRVLARYTGFSNELAKYADWRDDVLQASLEILKEEASSPSPDAYQARWTEHFARAGAEASQKIVDAVRDTASVAPRLCAFAETVATQEAAFFGLCARMTLARMSAQALLYSIGFDVETRRLEEKWRALGDSDRSIDEKIAATSRQVLNLFEETVEKVIAEQRGLAGKAAEVKPDPGKVITDWKSALAELLKLAVYRVNQAIEPYKKGTAVYVDALAALLYQEETLVLQFCQIRESVRDFVQRTRYEVAAREYNETVAQAEALAQSSPTAGLRKDATLFARTAAEAVKPFMDELKQGHEDFMSEFKERFTGPVGDKTLDELLELSESLQSWEEIERFDLPARLDAALQEFRNSWTVDVEGLGGDDVDALREVWKQGIEALAKDILEAKDDRVRDRIGQYLRDRKKDLADKLERSKGGGE